MRTKLTLLLLASALSGCASMSGQDVPDQGLDAINAPVLTRTDYTIDLAAPGGVLSPEEQGRLQGWFRGVGASYGDAIALDGPYAEAARPQIADIAGMTGLLVQRSAPVTPGSIPAGSVRVVLSRAVVSVPNCPNWGTPSQPNYDNRNMPNFGCAVNGNLAAMVANPYDLLRGRGDLGSTDALTAAKAINMYRTWPLTGVIEGQTKRPLISSTRKPAEEE